MFRKNIFLEFFYLIIILSGCVQSRYIRDKTYWLIQSSEEATVASVDTLVLDSELKRACGDKSYAKCIDIDPLDKEITCKSSYDGKKLKIEIKNNRLEAFDNRGKILFKAVRITKPKCSNHDDNEDRKEFSVDFVNTFVGPGERNNFLPLSTPIKRFGSASVITKPIADKKFRCIEENVRETSYNRSLSGIDIIEGKNLIFPGSFLQAKSIAGHNLKAIDMVRKTYSVNLSGKIFDPGNAVKLKVDQATRLGVLELGKMMLKGFKDKTKLRAKLGNPDLEIKQFYSLDHLLYIIGATYAVEKEIYQKILKRLGPNVAADNYYLLSLKQPFYKACSQDFKNLSSAFTKSSLERLQGVGSDREKLVSSTNPPVYVDCVTYGNSDFFLVVSPYSLSSVEKMTKAAYANKQEAKEFTDLLSRSEVYHILEDLFTPSEYTKLTSSKDSSLYFSLQYDLAQSKKIDFTKLREIDYSLKFLSQDVPVLSFTTKFLKVDCKLFDSKQEDFVLDVSSQGATAYIWTDKDTDKYKMHDYKGYDFKRSGDFSLKLSSLLKGKQKQTTRVTLQFDNDKCSKTSINVSLKNSLQEEFFSSECHRSIWNDCGWIYRLIFDINPSTGEVARKSYYCY
jgi:hypothetical protein